MPHSAGSPPEAPPAAAQPPPGRPHEQADADRAFFVRLKALLLGTARATLAPLLVFALAAGAALLYGVPGPARAAVLLVAAIPAIWRFAGAVLHGLFRAEPQLRLVQCNDATARHLRRWLGLVARLFAVFAPLGWALEANHYPRGAVDALWLAYEALTLVALVALLGRRGLAEAVLPRAERPIGKALRRIAVAAYPFFALYVVAVLAIHALGYVNLARFLGRATALSGAVLAGAAIVWKYAAYRLDAWNERRLAAAAAAGPSGGAEAGPELERHRGLYLAASALVRYAVAAGTLLGLLFAWGLDARQVQSLISGKTIGWSVDGQRVGISILDLFESALILIVTFLGGRLARTVFLGRLRERSTLDRGTQEALGNAAFFLVVAFGGYFALATLKVNLEVVKYLGGALGIGIGFGLQNIVNNFVSGIILLVEKPIRTDDIVEVSGVLGRVDRIGTRSTVVMDVDNVARIVPNAEFVSAQVTNWSYGDLRTRVRCPVGVAYGTDPHLVREALLGVAGQHGLVLKKPAPDVLFKEFGDSSLNFELVCYVAEPARIAKIRSDLNFSIEAAFRKHGVEIPFPQRDLHLFQKAPLVHRVELVRRDGGNGAPVLEPEERKTT
jgi:small-conductance mechanosensitive channel